jgi:hypothetical protein
LLLVDRWLDPRVHASVEPTLALIRWLGVDDPNERRRRFWLMFLDPQLRRLHLDLWDRVPMAHSIEVRVPFLTREVTLAAIGWRGWNRPDPKAVLKAELVRLYGEDLGGRIAARPKEALPTATRQSVKSMSTAFAALVPRSYIERHPARILRAPYDDPARAVVGFDIWNLLFNFGFPPDEVHPQRLYSRADLRRVALDAAIDALGVAVRAQPKMDGGAEILAQLTGMNV